MRTYRKTGFLPYITLTETFLNKYTNISGEKLQVRAMKAEDIYNATGLSEMSGGRSMNLEDVKYNKLFVTGATYFIASVSQSVYLWNVKVNGEINEGHYYYGDEYRNSSNCFFAF